MSQGDGASPSIETQFARAGGIMVAGLFLSRVLGLLRDSVIAAQFGLRLENDAFRIAVQIPDLLFMLIAGGGLSSAFLPIFSEYLHTGREKQAWRLFSVVVTVTTLIVLGLIGAAWVFAEALVAFIGAGQSAETLSRALPMARILLPAQYAFLVGSVLLATLYARKQFAVPSLAPNVYNLGIILGAAALPGLMGLGIEGVAWGALAGAILGNLIFPIVAMLRIGSQFRPSLDVRTEGVGKFFKLLLPVIVGFSLPSMLNLITQKFASGYGEGANTALSYANNLMQAPLGIFGQSLAMAAFPVLAQFYAEQNMQQFREQVTRTLRTVIYLTVPASAVLFGFGNIIVDVIYAYGSAQDPEQLQAITDCLRIYTIGIVAWCIQPVLMRSFFSLHQTFVPVAWGTLATVVFIVGCVSVEGNAYGFRAIPWVTNAAIFMLVAALYVALERRTGSLNMRAVLVTLAKTLLGAAFICGLAYMLEPIIDPLPKAFKIGAVLFSLCMCGWIYFWVTSLLNMPETAYLSRAFDRMQKRPDSSR